MKKILGLMLLVLPIFSAPLFAAERTAIFPRFASGSGWTSEFFFTNQGISAVSGVVVTFIDNSGAVLPVTTNLGTNSSFTFNLPAGATQALRITPGGAWAEGHVEVSYPSVTSPVRASQVYRYEQNGTVQVEMGIPQQELGDHFSFPVVVNSAQQTYSALALTNPTTVGQTLVLNLIRTDGTIQATSTVNLAAGNNIVGFLDNANWLFPGLDNFTGSLSVSSQFGVGVLTFRQDKSGFGAVSTDGGPVLAPFVVSSPTTTEAEPNDFIEEAQVLTLPVQVHGSIGFADDYDYYQFSGQAGKILTILCDTTQLSSSLDSLVRVFDSSQNEIAYNDQNGLAPALYPQNDSFIQVVLPSTGIYYIEVTDFWGGVGGATGYGYNLHLKLR